MAKKNQSRKHEIWKTRNFIIFFFEFSYFRDKGFTFPIYLGWEMEMIKFKQKQGERDSEAGFTLLEVIAAVSILTVGLLAVASMQTAAIQGNDKAYRVTEGATWAQNRLEYLMALPYDHQLLSIDPEEKTDLNYEAPDGYTITRIVVGGPVTNTKLITVIAARQDRGATKFRQLTSIKNNL